MVAISLVVRVMVMVMVKTSAEQDCCRISHQLGCYSNGHFHGHGLVPGYNHCHGIYTIDEDRCRFSLIPSEEIKKEKQ